MLVYESTNDARLFVLGIRWIETGFCLFAADRESHKGKREVDQYFYFRDIVCRVI